MHKVIFLIQGKFFLKHDLLRRSIQPNYSINLSHSLILLINENSRCIDYTGCFCVVCEVIPLLR